MDATDQRPSPIVAGLACRCPRCGKGKLFRGFLTLRPKCEHCGGAKLNRLVSKFAVHRPGAGFDDPSSIEDLDESDPRAVARWARKMKEEAGEDLGPEFDDMVDRIEAGEDPEGVMADSALYDKGMDDGDDF